VNTALTTAIVTACEFAAVRVGMWLRRFLPDHHVSPDSRDTVKLAMGLVATMSAVLPDLLVSSAKISYETTHTQVMRWAAKSALIASALCVAGAIFLILALDDPFNGLMRISSEPMLNLFRHPGS